MDEANGVMTGGIVGDIGDEAFRTPATTRLRDDVAIVPFPDPVPLAFQGTELARRLLALSFSVHVEYLHHKCSNEH